MSRIPNTSQPGLFLQSLGDGQDGSVWGSSQLGPTNLTMTMGAVSTTGLLIPVVVPVPVGATGTFLGVWTMGGGAFIDGTFEQNGTAIPGMSNGYFIQYFPLYSQPTSPQVVNNGDYFNFSVEIVSIAATFVTMTYVFDIS